MPYYISPPPQNPLTRIIAAIIAVFALVGANGAGKSSTIMAIAGHVEVQGGMIELDGEDITALPVVGLQRVRGVAAGDAVAVVTGVHVSADPVEVAQLYDAQEADEIPFLDISASHEGRSILLDVVARTAEQCFIPVTVGGGTNV